MSIYEIFEASEDNEEEAYRTFIRCTTEIFYSRKWHKMADLEIVLFQLESDYGHRIYRQLKKLASEIVLWHIWGDANKRLVWKMRFNSLKKMPAEKIKSLSI